MVDDLVDLSTHLDATEASDARKPRDAEAFDQLMQDIADAINNELLRVSGDVGFTGDLPMGGNDIVDLGDLIGQDADGDPAWRIHYDSVNDEAQLQKNTGTAENPSWTTRFTYELDTSGQLYVRGNEVWHEGNQGSGSGMDADTLRNFTPTQLLGDAAGTIVSQRILDFVASDGQTSFTLTDFDPTDEIERVFSGGVRMLKGASNDYTRSDEEATVSGSSSNDGTYTVRTPEVSYDSDQNVTTIPVVEGISDPDDETGDITIDATTWSILSVLEDENAFQVSGDQTGTPDDSTIEFNSGRAADEIILVEIPNFASQGEGSGFDADTLDGQHASEIEGNARSQFISPVEIYNNDVVNDEETVDLSNHLPEGATWVLLQGSTEQTNAQDRLLIVTASPTEQDPSGIHNPYVLVIATTGDSDHKSVNKGVSWVEVNSNLEVKIKKYASPGQITSGVKTTVWLKGYIT